MRAMHSSSVRSQVPELQHRMKVWVTLACMSSDNHRRVEHEHLYV
jgi:hypothetical protein